MESIFCLTEIVRFVPGCEDKYLKSRIEMYYDDKYDDTNDQEDGEKKELESGNTYKCKYTRYQERDEEKYHTYEERAEVEEECREIKSSRDRDIVYGEIR